MVFARGKSVAAGRVGTVGAEEALPRFPIRLVKIILRDSGERDRVTGS